MYILTRPIHKTKQLYFIGRKGPQPNKATWNFVKLYHFPELISLYGGVQRKVSNKRNDEKSLMKYNLCHIVIVEEDDEN